MIQEFDWLEPAPFWSSNGHRQADFFRPAMFRIDNDDFMEEFVEAAAAPTAVPLLEARLKQDSDNPPQKLFHPAHGAFYLTAASLCCREPGFPDRYLEQAEGERLGFVLRKLVNQTEYAWVGDEHDEIATGKKGWLAVGSTGRKLLPGEEQLALFQVPLACGRRLFCGYVPVSSSETYAIPASVLAVDNQPEEVDPPEIQELSARFIVPLVDPDSGSPLIDNLPDDIAWTTSVYLLVELWEYLLKYLPDVAAALDPEASPPVFSGSTAQEQSDLLDYLNEHDFTTSVTLGAGLSKVSEDYEDLNQTGGGDLAALGFEETVYNMKTGSGLTEADFDTLRDLVEAALPAEAAPALEMPKLDVSSSVSYVIRFVYVRPQCEDVKEIVSTPTQAFTFAPFFDADAPARPVRIPLPSDVSISGLRKASKNVTFMMSDAMRKKMDMLFGKETAILDDPEDVNNEDSTFDFAFICSFSIQIIFIVAFMLLLIFVVVFNFIFWWLAFFKICLPIPKALLPD